MRTISTYILLLAWVCLTFLPAAGQQLINPYRFTAPPASFTAKAAAFESTNLEYIRRTSTVTGIADSSVFTFSCHVRMDTNDGSERFLMSVGDASVLRLGIARTATNFIEVYGLSSAGSLRVNVISSGTTVTTASGWVHVVIVVDTSSTSLCKIYLDGVEQTYSTRTVGAGVIDLAPATWRYSVATSSSTTPSVTLGGALSEVWLDDVYLDDPTQFATAGVPISLGATGQLPTGSAPAFYLSLAGDGNSWVGDSSGNGNNFTETPTSGLSSTTAP